MAIADVFLKISDGIDGESLDDKHKNEIEIDSFSWGVTQSGTAGRTGTGQGAGKASFQDIHFTAKVNKASPKLMLACATGQHLAEATLSVRKAGGQQEDYLKIKLTGILVSSYQEGGSGHGDIVPVDQFSLNFAKTEVTYKQQTEKGSVGSPVVTGYDLSANKKL
jgi:type VI secretion system secreted protein Hcp